MPRPVTRQTRIYLALWRKAYTDLQLSGPDDFEPLTIFTAKQSLAVSHKTGLYAAIRPYREAGLDPILHAASEALVVKILTPEETGTELFQTSLCPRETFPSLDEALTRLGISDKDLLTPEEQEAERLVEKLVLKSEETEAPRATPFYTRD